METRKVIILARKHVDTGEMVSSARQRLADAVQLYDNGDFDAAKIAARHSLLYSIGAFHPDYKRAK